MPLDTMLKARKKWLSLQAWEQDFDAIALSSVSVLEVQELLPELVEGEEFTEAEIVAALQEVGQRGEITEALAAIEHQVAVLAASLLMSQFEATESMFKGQAPSVLISG